VRLPHPADRDLAWLGWRRRAESWSAVVFGATGAEAERRLNAAGAAERHTGAAVVLPRGERPEWMPAGAAVVMWGFGLKRSDPAYEVWAGRCGAIPR
jgi:hypothetical protein